MKMKIMAFICLLFVCSFAYAADNTSSSTQTVPTGGYANWGAFYQARGTLYQFYKSSYSSGETDAIKAIIKDAVDILQQSNDQYKLLLANSTSTSGDIDISGIIQTIDKSYDKLLELKPYLVQEKLDAFVAYVNDERKISYNDLNVGATRLGLKPPYHGGENTTGSSSTASTSTTSANTAPSRANVTPVTTSQNTPNEGVAVQPTPGSKVPYLSQATYFKVKKIIDGLPLDTLKKLKVKVDAALAKVDSSNATDQAKQRLKGIYTDIGNIIDEKLSQGDSVDGIVNQLLNSN